jgi:3alpha(or 20beta)-hydroxysteroid dehydrogenase
MEMVMSIDTGSQRLEGKVALITGAGSGMGVTHAQLFAREGAKVILTDIDEEAGLRIAGELGEAALFLSHDVTDPNAWTSVVAAGSDHFGPITVLVNNAGVAGPVQKSLELTIDAYLKTIEVDQHGTYYGMRAVIPGMIDSGGGSIVNISSAAGMAASVGFPNIAYVASKFAVRGLTKAAAMEFAPQNIRVNSVHPGAVLTPLTLEAFDAWGEEFRTSYEKAIPMRRLGDPLEISRLVLFLASDDSSYSTGAEFICDGGLLAE